VLALTPDPDAPSLRDLCAAGDLDNHVCVLVGAEGPGLSVAAQRSATRRVRLPMAPGVDSLNLATAAAIALYEVRLALAARD
jgi:tRNA G18 (ribose-2'-O)-methylase SpoU